MKVTLNLIILSIAAIAVAGCATPQSPDLIQAEHAYTEAITDPVVTKNAAVTLQDAEKALNRARNAEDIEEQKHFAYLAGKKIELAKVQADHAEARTRVAQLEEQQARYERRAYRSQGQEQAQSELQQLRMELAKSQETDAGVMLTLTDVVFALDEAQLKPGAERGLSRLSSFLRKYPERRILVEGFTDSSGSEDYNQELSEDRAQAVARALEADGILPDRITARGLGEQYPVAPNNTEAGRQQNRRVEITILNTDREAEDAGRRGGRI